MEFLKKLFKSSKNQSDSWTMFSTSKIEIFKMLISNGDLTFGDDFLKIKNYPFEPSIAYKQSIIKVNQIDEIDLKSYPPTINVGNELIYLTTEKKVELEEFATKHNVKSVERQWIWTWLLEPFLDTEYTLETDQRLAKLLEDYGLSIEKVKLIREEVRTQMMKYNFDTMIWEWGGFNADDVLKAMRTKYNKEEFEDFYKRVMQIALLTKITD